MIRNKGFTIVEVVIVLAIVGLVGVIGWRVWSANQDSTSGTDTTQNREPETQDINSTADLDTADKALNETNLEGSDRQQLDTQTSF